MFAKVFKKNQIIISVIALMLITVGYMNYTNNITHVAETNAEAVNTEGTVEQMEMAGIGDAKLVDSQAVVETNSGNEVFGSSQLDEDVTNNELELNSTVSTSSTANSYFTLSRIERNKMYSEMIETYQNVVANASTSDEQKNRTTQEIVNINSEKNSIMIAENLIKNLGFEDVVIFKNDKSVSVIVRADTLQEADVAQIQNVVCRELNVSAEVVHISVR